MFTLAANGQPTRGVHVLLVDSDLASLTATARMLELLSYRVTVTQTGRAALSILEDRRNGINLVITDIGLHDVNGLMVLGEAMRRHIITIMMAGNMNMNMFVIKMALHSGASLFIHKPLNSIVARDLWQFVERARILYKPPIRIPQAAEVRNLRYDSEDDSDSSEIGSLDISERNPKKKKRVQRTSTPWTDELHAKFVDAVVHLGERNCYPKEILERMNVSDLTRMQVASHLQKCRDGMWHGPEDNRPFIRETCDLDKHSGSGKFGAIPLSVKLQLATSPGSRVVAPELRLGFMDAPSCSKAGSDAPSTSSSGGSSVEKKFYEIMAKLGRDNGSLKIRSPKKEPASP